MRQNMTRTNRKRKRDFSYSTHCRRKEEIQCFTATFRFDLHTQMILNSHGIIWRTLFFFMLAGRLPILMFSFIIRMFVSFCKANVKNALIICQNQIDKQLHITNILTLNSSSRPTRSSGALVLWSLSRWPSREETSSSVSPYRKYSSRAW